MIYFVQPRCGGPIKIGLTDVEYEFEVGKRVGAIENACPWPVDILWVEKGGRDREMVLHKRFAGLRHHREWFIARGALRAYLENKGVVVGPVWPDQDFWLERETRKSPPVPMVREPKPQKVTSLADHRTKKELVR